MPRRLSAGNFFSSSYVNTTSSAEKALPSVHFTPFCSWSVNVLLSSDQTHDFASHGNVVADVDGVDLDEGS